MKIFLATARTDDVAWGAAHGMLDGVYTTPGMLSASEESTALTRACGCGLRNAFMKIWLVTFMCST